MALNMVRKYSKTEVWPVGSGIADGVAVLNSTVANTAPQPGVTLTGSGNYTKSTTVGPYTISGIPAGGIGLAANDATVAVDGAFRFPVVGMTTSIVKNTIVYAVVTGTAPALVVTGLTLTSGGTNVKFGKVDRYLGVTTNTETSVTIGVF